MSQILDDKQLVTKVCKLFYIDNKNQKEIAEELGLSRPTISRMIAKGKDLGIINVKINERYNSKYLNLEDRLKEVFELKEVIIVEDHNNSEEREEKFAKAIASYLSQVLIDEMVIGISYGSVLSKVASHLLYSSANDLKVIPLIGEIQLVELELQANSNTYRLSKKLEADYDYLFFPAQTVNPLARLIYKNYTDFFNQYKKLDVALFEVLPVYSYIYRESFKFSNYLETIETNAVGEILFQNYNMKGALASKESTIGYDIKNLSKLKYSIGFSFGLDNLLAVTVAIKKKLLNVLIIDHRSAQKLIDFYN